MYPSYHCKVSFDVTSTGSVPVHVKLAGSRLAIFRNGLPPISKAAMTDGVQLHSGSEHWEYARSISTSPTIRLLLKALPTPLAGPSWLTQWNEDPPAPGAVVLLEGSYAVVSSTVEIENLAGLDYEILDNGDGTVTFNLWPTLFDGSPYLQALTVGIVNEAGTFSQDLTYGSSDGTPPVDELVSGDGGVTYSYTAPAGSLPSGEVGIFLMVNGRAPDDGNDLQRWIGITSMMTTSNDFGGFDWSWANRFKITLP